MAVMLIPNACMAGFLVMKLFPYMCIPVFTSRVAQDMRQCRTEAEQRQAKRQLRGDTGSRSVRAVWL